MGLDQCIYAIKKHELPLDLHHVTILYSDAEMATDIKINDNGYFINDKFFKDPLITWRKFYELHYYLDKISGIDEFNGIFYKLDLFILEKVLTEIKPNDKPSYNYEEKLKELKDFVHDYSNLFDEYFIYYFASW